MPSDIYRGHNNKQTNKELEKNAQQQDMVLILTLSWCGAAAILEL